jgi:hypothetical protein
MFQITTTNRAKHILENMMLCVVRTHLRVLSVGVSINSRTSSENRVSVGISIYNRDNQATNRERKLMWPRQRGFAYHWFALVMRCVCVYTHKFLWFCNYLLTTQNHHQAY